MFQVDVFTSNSRKPGHQQRLGLPACLCMAGFVLSLASSVRAYDSQSDGSDGAFNPQSDVTIHLGLATNGHWRDTPGTDVNGDGMSDGVYDAEQWAVVFKFTTINIPDGVTVRFTNHPKGAPVVWLASGDVNIAGTVNLSGKNGGTAIDPAGYAEGGPGGFSGGIRSGTGSPGPSAGMGPGGAQRANDFWGGGFGTAGQGSGGGIAYGTPSLIPLIGGSGGEGGSDFGGGGGGAGGGAILIASSTLITIVSPGRIISDGGAGGTGNGGNSRAGNGSGGGIRLVADLVAGDGSLLARGGNPALGNGHGRIRIDGANGLTGETIPMAVNGGLAPLFPEPASPKLQVTAVHNSLVPSDPLGHIGTDDVLIGRPASPVTIQIRAENIEPGTVVQVRIAPTNGSAFTVASTPLDGSYELSTATATASFPVGSSAVYVRAPAP